MTRIVVSYSPDSPRHPASFSRVLQELAAGAAAAAHDVGLELVWVDATAPSAGAGDLVAGTDGVIVLGGADVDPALYRRPPAGAHVEMADAAADVFEIDLVRAAIAASSPLFTICRGTQLLNVALGGTLVQDLPPGIHRDPAPSAPMLTHPVDVREGTRLASVLGAGAHEVRSGHHQAVDRLGEGLVVSAAAPDGVVEAIELAGDAWAVGVQWHPEESAADPEALRALLTAFAAAVRARAQRTRRARARTAVS